jgi:hypothetical protein
MVKMPNNEAESEDSGPEVNTSESDSEMSDSSDSSESPENELRISRKNIDYNDLLGEFCLIPCVSRQIVNFSSFSRPGKTICRIARGIV